jgi:hypothetical protein
LKVTIKNDTGLGDDTKIIAEDGREMQNVLAVKSVLITCDDHVHATMKVIAPELDLAVKDAEIQLSDQTENLLKELGYVKRFTDPDGYRHELTCDLSEVGEAAGCTCKAS